MKCEEVRPSRSSTEGQRSAAAGTYPFDLAELRLLLLFGLLQVAPVWVLVILLPLGVLLLLQHGTEVHAAGVCREWLWLTRMRIYINHVILVLDSLLNEVTNTMHMFSSTV